MALKDSTIQRVREVPLTEILAAEAIPFKRIGREAVTLCPWHADSNPSLTINDDKNLCFCFACGGGSDGIAFVEQKFGISFADAVTRIADKHGITVEHDNLDPEEALRIAQQRRQALDSLRQQQDRFRQAIKGDTGFRARMWLLQREITPEASRYFELGYAEAGYFSDRVTVPIHDHRGTLVGFTGRRIEDAPAAGDEPPPAKYKNSAASELFDKGSLIYNEHRAVQTARTAGYLVFVEGHFDVISMWRYGIPNVVATQGTAGPAPESIRRLMRSCRRFVLCYDGDDGGRKAIEHFVKVAGPLACKGELTLTVAQLPEGTDPDDCIRKGLDLHGIIESAPQWLDWQLDVWLKGVDRSDTHTFSKFEQAIRKFVESIASPALRQHYVDKAAKVLAADSKAATKLAQAWSKDLPKIRQHAKWEPPTPAWTRNQVERRVLRSYIHFPATRKRLAGLMEHLEGPSNIWLWKRIQELEAVSQDVNPHMVMAILAVCEPYYLRLLRPLAVPTIQMTYQEGVIDHAERILKSKLHVDL